MRKFAACLLGIVETQIIVVPVEALAPFWGFDGCFAVSSSGRVVELVCTGTMQ